MTAIIATALERWVGWVCMHHRVVIMVMSALTVLSVFAAASQLRINTNTEDMISRDLPWRQHQIEFKKNFPQLVRNIVVVIDGYTPELAEQARSTLAAAISEKPEFFRSVYSPGGGAFFDRHGLLFLNEDELFQLTDQIASAQPFLQKLAQRPSLETLFDLLVRAIEKHRVDDSLDNVFQALTAAFTAENENRFHRMSWQEQMQTEPVEVSDRRRLLLVEPNPNNAKNAIQELRNKVIEQDMDKDAGISIGITGSVAMEAEELQSVSRGALFTALLTLVLVTVVLLLALSSPKLIAASLITLIAGLSMTAAFAAIAIGDLNIISVAFAVLYIGLGIDFAIHFCMHVRHHPYPTGSITHALTMSAREVGPSLLICAITTAIGFYAFIPTDFSGVSQLGIISGTGMFISFILSVTFLPSLIARFQPDFTPRTPASPWVTVLGRRITIHKQVIRLSSVGIAIIALVLSNQIRFDNNPVNLRDQNTASVKTFLDLIDNSETPPLTLSVLSPNEADAQRNILALQRYEEVKNTIWIGSFVPQQQESKLALIDETNLVLGGPLPEPLATISNPETDYASISHFINVLADYINTTEEGQATSARDLHRAIQSWRNSVPDASNATQLSSLTETILATLPFLITRLNKLLSADKISMTDLPASLIERWISDDGQYRIEVLPGENVNQHETAARFVNAVESSAAKATGLPVIHIKAGATVVDAFRTAFITAFVLIGIILFVLFRRLKDSGAVISQLLLAAILTSACAVLFNTPFNFANIIALPLLLGVGVDSGIHMVHRSRAQPPADGNLLATSTSRAVFYSTLTTMCSFCGLALSSHPGTASMGRLLSMGMIMVLFCSLIVLPALIATSTNIGNQDRPP